MVEKYEFGFLFEGKYLTQIKLLRQRNMNIEEIDIKDVEYNARNIELNKILKNLINGIKRKEVIKYKFKGTAFQEKVWKEIEKIPYGETRTYKDIAVAIGNSKASRAVGSACNKNPLPILIPCHRVISSNGKINGYVYGNKLKAHILDMESKNKMK